MGVLELRSMFLVTVRARPTEHAEDQADVGGGYVNCWLSAATEDEAIARALAEVRDAEWIAEAVETVEAVTRETYADPDHPGREYFEQALVDGTVIVFHVWPNEPQDDDELH